MKKAICIAMLIIMNSSIASKKLELHHNSIQSLGDFSLQHPAPKIRQFVAQNSAIAKPQNINQLRKFSVSASYNNTVVRYQQYYKSIPVIGGQVSMSGNRDNLNGQLYQDIDISITPKFSKQNILALIAELNNKKNLAVKESQVELQIRFINDNIPNLVYQISFSALDTEHNPHQPVYLVDANTGQILKQWDNLKHFKGVGSGGNLKTHQYWYGQDGLPPLEVKKRGELCIMENKHVRLVNLHSAWDWSNNQMSAYEYGCHSFNEEHINGAYSPINDAYFFGGIIVDMYRDWYDLNALQHPNGQSMQLIMRVHFGENFDNAFWDGQAMSFGDGSDFYPLVSLDVAGHEVSHGFTQQHANLEYHDESGALNESFSDMAGIVTRAYLLESIPLLHQKIYLGLASLTWGIGETITKSDGALRYMDLPSQDGQSADCFDKMVAFNHGSVCTISYSEVEQEAKNSAISEEQQQGYIVHHGSGVFNRAFYLMAKEFGVKQSFHIMVNANFQYWNQTSNFKLAACGVIDSAKDLSQSSKVVENIMGQVGIDISDC